MISRIFKGTHTLCRCSHFVVWVEGQDDGCEACLAEEIGQPITSQNTLKPGVQATRNGRYLLNGRLIKKEDAYQ
jgi:hypothetical protein